MWDPRVGPAPQVVRKVGRGKYSEVFEGRRTASGARCIIKARVRRRSRSAPRPARSRPAPPAFPPADPKAGEKEED